MFFIAPDKIVDRLPNTAIVMLTYVQLLGQMKSKLPIISEWTIGEYIITFFLCLSMLTIISPIECMHLHRKNDDEGKCDPQVIAHDEWLQWISLTMHLVAIFAVCVYSKYHTRKFLKQKVPS